MKIGALDSGHVVGVDDAVGVVVVVENAGSGLAVVVGFAGDDGGGGAGGGGLSVDGVGVATIQTAWATDFVMGTWR